MQTLKNNVYTVSKLNGEVRQILENQLGKIWLEAEISNFSSPSSGHWYLTLKDSRSQIRCAMFKGRNRSVTFVPNNGQQVLVKGTISVYEPRGDYQLIIDSMLPAGDGLLAQQYEALKMKLAAEGMFSVETKRALPSPIGKIGIITSPTGAAIRDILHVLHRRDPSLEVVIYPSQVQGEIAAKELCRAIEVANERAEVDVLLLTRGGGSLEDLWCFNSEALAHTIYNSAIPVVSAVGHEVDTTISDYVADLRAPTPSAAAEILSSDSEQRRQQVNRWHDRLQQSWQHFSLKRANQLQHIQHQLSRQDPKVRLQSLQQKFDEFEYRLNQSVSQKLNRHYVIQQQLSARLLQRSPANKLDLAERQLTYLSQRLDGAVAQTFEQAKQRFESAAHQLDTVSPLSTLGRGYSISRNNKGQLLTSSHAAKIGETVVTQLHQGSLTSTITHIDES